MNTIHDYRKTFVCILFLISLTSCAGYYNNRGNAYLEKGEFDQAISAYTKAIELNPKLHFAYSNRGNAYKDKGQLDKAIADYSRAIELFNSRTDADELSVVAYVNQSRVIDLNSKLNTAFYINRGNAYQAKDQLEQAIDDYSKAIKINPNYSDVYVRRGNTYQLKGQMDQAIADYNKAIDLNTDNDYAYLHLLVATWLSKGEDLSLVEKLRQRLVSNKSDEWVKTILRYYLGLHGLNQQAVLLEAKNGKDSKENRERLCEAYYYLGVKLLVEGYRNDATDFFSKSIETSVYDYIEYYLSRAMLFQMQEGKI